MSAAKVIVLVSEGRHPVSARTRRADQDAQALELALQTSSIATEVLFAGRQNEKLMRAYLGMGVPIVDCLCLDEGLDPVPAIVRYLKTRSFHAVLAGSRAETGRGSGLLPYAIAQSLDVPLVPGISALQLNSGDATVEQSLPGGQSRRLGVSGPFVATVCQAAPDPRPTTFVRARRGIVITHHAHSVPDEWRLHTECHPARTRPHRIHSVAISGPANKRLEAATGATLASGKIMINPSPDDAASAIIEFLQTEKIL